MADFVGLLKKTIESQSQMTPQLRQRIYERARATVERKLAESQAPEAVADRQREVLNRAIDEVEAHYHAADEMESQEQDEPAKGDEALPLSVVNSAPPLSTLQEEKKGDREIASHLPEAASPLTDPPPFEEAFEREESLAPTATESSPSSPESSSSKASGDEASSPAAFSSMPDSLESLVQPVLPQESQLHDATDSLKTDISKPEIPSLASLLKGDEEEVSGAPESLPPLDLPFLSQASELDNEEYEEKREAVADLLADESAQSSVVASQEAYSFADEILPQLSPASQSGEMVQKTGLEGETVSADQAKRSPVLLEEYLPHWPIDEGANAAAGDKKSNEQDEALSIGSVPLGTQVSNFVPASSSHLPSFFSSSPSLSSNLTFSGNRTESEIERARRDIEALRSGEAVPGEQDLPPFDRLPFSSDDSVPVADMTEATVHGEADSNNDLVSEIFVQAAKREQRQSSKKQRIAAFVIGVVVLAVLAAIGGVLVLTNEYQIGDRQDIVAQTPAQTATFPDNGGGAAAIMDAGEGSNSTLGAEGGEAPTTKITRRLLPDGEEIDVGLAVENATPGEGTSQAMASLPAVDNSARAVFYEAPTDMSSATANNGRVEWSLRRSSVSMPNGDQVGQAQQEDLAIVGDVKIPALDMTLRLTLRRNHDLSVPADYLTEVVFALPDDFDGGAIDRIDTVLFKASEQSIGQELAGSVIAKVQDNLFLMAVRAPRPVLDRNLALMRQLPWLKLNVFYKNGRIGEFSIAKGEGGQRIFQQAIDEWSRLMDNDQQPAAEIEADNRPLTDGVGSSSLDNVLE